MPQLYFDRDDIKIRIEEVRRLKVLFEQEEQELVWQWKSLEDKEDCVVDLRGRVVGVNGKKKKTTYGEVNAEQEIRAQFQKKLYKAHGVKIYRT
jgi:hypothetical protein